MEQTPVIEMKYDEPQLGAPATDTRLEYIFGLLPRVTTTPTWKPKSFRDSFALDTSTAKFYYYDYTNQLWRSIGGSGGTPGGSDTQIQFNDATAFGGNALMTFNKAAGGGLSLAAPAGATNGDGGAAHLIGGAGDGTGKGGMVEVLSGAGGATGNAGTIFIDAGASVGAGASCDIQGGLANGLGGSVDVSGGAGTGNKGGTVSLFGGNASSSDFGGGDVAATAGQGHGTGNGGDVSLSAGAGGASGAKGDVKANAAAISTSANGGFLVIPRCAGAPTGTPATAASVVFDTTNNKLYVWNGSAWKSVTLT